MPAHRSWNSFISQSMGSADATVWLLKTPPAQKPQQEAAIRDLLLCHFAVNHAGKVHKVRTWRARCASACTRTTRTRAAAHSCTAGSASSWTSWTTGATRGWWRFAQALPDLIQGLAL